jgi:hypothetical protein
MISSLRDPKYVLALSSIVTVIFIVQYFVPIPALSYITLQLGNWGIIFSAYALIYGLLSQSKRNIDLITKSKGRDLYSLWILVVSVVTFALGVFNLEQPQYKWIFNYIYTTLGATLFSFSFLYTASAAVRVLRARNVPSTLFMLAAVITILGDAPTFRSIAPWLFDLRSWVTGEASRGPYVAFNMSLGIGMVLIGLRSILGLERGWTGERRLLGEE